jgi:Na+/melibiose symporter-like transporter
VNDNASDSVNETADLAPGKLGGRGWRDIFLYGLARLVLFIVLTVVIQLIAVLLGMGQSFPLAISALLALIIAFPLSMFVFKDLRLRVNEHLAVRDAGRRAHKDQMRAQLEERQD